MISVGDRLLSSPTVRVPRRSGGWAGFRTSPWARTSASAASSTALRTRCRAGGRAGAARGPRPRPRPGPSPAAARRAVRRARSASARRAPHRGRPTCPRPAVHHPARHPRSGGGALTRRPCGRDAKRPHTSAGNTHRHLRAPGEPLGGELRRRHRRIRRGLGRRPGALRARHHRGRALHRNPAGAGSPCAPGAATRVAPTRRAGNGCHDHGDRLRQARRTGQFRPRFRHRGSRPDRGANLPRRATS